MKTVSVQAFFINGVIRSIRSIKRNGKSYQLKLIEEKRLTE
jgi:hypothetical protein